jgi:hypothetical protein
MAFGDLADQSQNGPAQALGQLCESSNKSPDVIVAQMRHILPKAGTWNPVVDISDQVDHSAIKRERCRQAERSSPGRAALILVDLLDPNTDCGGQRSLRHSERFPPSPDLQTHRTVERIGWLIGSAARFRHAPLVAFSSNRARRMRPTATLRLPFAEVQSETLSAQ